MFASWIRKVRLILAVVALSTASSPSFAQFSANVQGTVTDQRGAVIPNVAMTLTNVDTGVQLTTKSDQAGLYRFSSVTPGNYNLEAVFSGFEKTMVSVPVTPNETRGVNITLRPAGNTVNVTVNTVATDLNPDETRIQTTLSPSQIRNIPLAGQDVQQLLALTPGVTGYQNVNPSAGYGSTLFGAFFNPPYQANGIGNNSNLFLLDDLPVQDAINQGAALILPNADSIDQVALQTQTYSVENGSSASLQVSFNTKSGTNRFHGDINYSYDSSGLGSAESVVNNITPGSNGGPSVGGPTHLPAPFHQNEILGSIGGPIWKDHTFAFFSIQRQNAGIGEPSALNEIRFDPAFVNWAVGAFPNSPFAHSLQLSPDTRDVPGPKFNASADTIYANSLSSGCGAQTTGGNTQYGIPATPYFLPCNLAVAENGYFFDQAQPFNGTQWFLRLDQAFHSGDRVYVAYERIHQYLGFLANRPNLDGATPSTTKYLSANWVHLFNSNLLNEARFANLRGSSGTILTNPAIAGSYPWAAPPALLADAGFAFFHPFGTVVPGGPDNSIEHTYAFRDTLSWTHGRHTVRGGYQWNRQDYLINNQDYARTFAFFGFAGSTPELMNDEVDFSGAIYSISGSTGKYQPQVYGATVFYNGIWAEDNWKVRPNFNLVLGLRYDSFGNPVPYSTSAPYAQVVPGAGATFQGQIANTFTHLSPRAFSEGQNVNFQPRVGFAWSPTFLHNATLHGGIGLYENTLTGAQIANNLPTQPPVRININLNQPIYFGDFSTATPPYGRSFNYPVNGFNSVGAPLMPNPNNPIPPGAPALVPQQIQLNAFTPNAKPEKYLLYSFSGEQQFEHHLIGSLAYAGSWGTGLLIGPNASGPLGVANADYNLLPGNTGNEGIAGGTGNTCPGTGTACYYNQNFAQIRLTRKDDITSNYNAMIASLRQTIGGLSYQASYTWSHALQWSPTAYSPSQGINVAFWPSPYYPNVYRGPSSIDVQNAFSFYGAYTVPSVFRDNLLLNEAASGWTLSGTIIAQSGSPFSVSNAEGSPSYSTDNSWAVDGSQGGTPNFPDYAPYLQRKGFSNSKLTLTGAFQASQFTDPPGAGKQFVLTNQGANSFRNPNFSTVNMSLAKAFPLRFLGEQASFSLRGDFINLFNHTNWQGIYNSVDGGQNFGFVTTANNKRFVQMGGRFQF